MPVEKLPFYEPPLSMSGGWLNPFIGGMKPSYPNDMVVHSEKQAAGESTLETSQW